VTENTGFTPGEESEGVPHSRIDALVRLLGDDDPKICAVAWDNLERIGEPALPLLEEAVRISDDNRVRVQSGRFLKEWSRREVFRRWVQFCKRGMFDLEEGALLVAQSEYPEMDVLRYRRMLDAFAGALRGKLATARTTDDAVRRVSALLFGEAGFQGNAADYYNPENSYLNRVLELRKGIPISLATVYLLVARRAMVPIEGVNMPQHFLLKYRSSTGDVFVDVFHGGKLLSVRDCARFLSEARIPFQEELLRSVPDREVLTRMLGNLLRIYLNADDKRRYDRIAAMLKLLD
jgi:regulator of sirC expression with transglutaminase-like and TPR domain